MTENNEISVGHDTPAASIERLSVGTLLPGENAADKEQVRVALLAEFAPKTAYETLLVQQLVEYEWDILRHRRLRDASVLEKYRLFATNLLAKGSAKTWARADDVTEEQLLLARDLVSPDPVERANAEEDFFIKTSWYPSHLLAMAAGNCAAAEAHEARIRDIELRRRQARIQLSDYRSVRRPDVEDAEIVEAAP